MQVNTPYSEDYEKFTWLKEEETINAAKVKPKTDSMSVDELKAAVNKFSSCYTEVKRGLYLMEIHLRCKT